MELTTVAIAEAIRRASASAVGRNEERVLGRVVSPLVHEHGADAVVAEFATGKTDPMIASALAYVVKEFTDLRLTEVFSADEIVAAALDCLLTPDTGWSEPHQASRIGNNLRHGSWAWWALFSHYPGDSGGAFEDEEHFRLVLELIERAPWDDDVLRLIGDGPFANACADDARYEQAQAMRKTHPKIARIYELPE